MEKQAFLLAKKWVLENYRTYRRTGKMWEKYDVVDSRPKVRRLLFSVRKVCFFSEDGRPGEFQLDIRQRNYASFRQASAGQTE